MNIISQYDSVATDLDVSGEGTVEINDTSNKSDNFASLKLITPLLDALNEKGFINPTSIQQKTIPSILSGKDVLATAKTGSGKTAAFVLPMLQLLSESYREDKPAVRGLIITPTRELARQISIRIDDFNSHVGLTHFAIFGGVQQKSQVHALEKGVDIIIATPGRLMDLIRQRHVVLNQLELFILDEADRMLDMGFLEDIEIIMRKIPKTRQILFFSATMPEEIKSLADEMSTNYELIEADQSATTVDTVDDTIYYVENNDKYNLLYYLFQNYIMSKVIVFVNTRNKVETIGKKLYRANLNLDVGIIHGEKDQSYRDLAIKQFKSGKINILIATDVVSRGIDIEDVTHVINFDIPEYPEDYVHRIGRTARAGREGYAYSFCAADERHHIRRIEELIGETINQAKSYPFKSRIPFDESD